MKEWQKSIQKTQELILSGELTIARVVETFVSNIDASKEHNHFIEDYRDEAIESAKAWDKIIQNAPENAPPLFGCIVSIKDNICYENHLATAGSNMLSGFKSSYSSTAVQRLIDQGAIIIGRTNCDEFGMGSTNENSNYGPVKNGSDTTLVPGGSSGGAAVSVQLGCCHVALGSDTGGSVRQPAAFCNVVGFKPEYGRISRWGLISYASSFDQIGILAHQVQDINTILQCISGGDGKDSTALHTPVPRNALQESSAQYSIAYLEDTFSTSFLDEDVFANAKSALDILGQHCELTPVKYSLLEYLVPCYYILTTAEASSNLARYDGIRYGHNSVIPSDTYEEKMRLNRTEGFGLEVKRRIMAGVYVLCEGYFDVYYQKAQKVRRMIQDELDSIFEKHDFIMLPTATSKPHKIGELLDDPIKMYNSDILTVLASLSGHPSISIPLNNKILTPGFSVQLIGRKSCSSDLLAYSSKICQIVDKQSSIY